MVSGEIRLSYYQQGDDLNSCLSYQENNKEKVNFVQTIQNHICLLQSSIQQLTRIAEFYKKINPQNVSLEGDNHCIQISGPVGFIKALIDENLVEKDPFESETSSQQSDKEYENEVLENFNQMLHKSKTEKFDDSDTELEYGIGSEIVHTMCQA